ncbi:MAG: amidase [Anaerolineae bacterium]
MKTLSEASAQIHSGMLRPDDLVEHCLHRIEKLDSRRNAFITVMADHARQQAEFATAAMRRGEDWGTLHGIPIAIKDLIDVEGVATTAGSDFFRHNTAAADAEVVTNLKAQGAIVIGKTNLDEFAMGVTTLNPHFNAAYNPWNPDHTPGGSSGGSGAAVAAGMALGALGTDTGGSVRIPSAFNNLSGLRPPTGLLSTRGVVPLSWTLDTVGPMAHTIRDVAMLMDALDPESDGYTVYLGQPVHGMRIGLPTNDSIWLGTSTQIIMRIREAVDLLADNGLVQHEVTLPDVERATRMAGLLSIADGAAYHYERLTKNPERFGVHARRRLDAGLKHTAVEYAAARQHGREWRAALREVFRQVDVIALPVTPIPPPRSDDVTPGLTRTLLSLTYGFSHSHLPALAIPCGFTDDGLPVGMQLVAPQVSVLLRLGDAYQHLTEWHQASPDLKL